MSTVNINSERTYGLRCVFVQERRDNDISYTVGGVTRPIKHPALSAHQD